MAHGTRPQRSLSPGVRRRDGHPHLAGSPLRLLPIGERAFFEIPRNRGKNTTLLTSLHAGGMGPSVAVEGATTARVSETYTERLLVPALRPGQVVVMDNLVPTGHRG